MWLVLGSRWQQESVRRPAEGDRLALLRGMATAKDLGCSGCKDKYFIQMVGRLNVEPQSSCGLWAAMDAWPSTHPRQYLLIKPAIFVYLFLKLLPNNAHCHVMIWALLLNTPMRYS